MFLGLLDRKSALDHKYEIEKLQILAGLGCCNFIMYYVYGSVRAIPAYGVYWLYDMVLAIHT